MASSWISGMIANGVQTAIQPAIASAGSFAGGAVSSVGTGVNGVGESISSYIRRYGNGIQDYGNAICDWTKAEGPRVSTASNPLGLSASTAGGKAGVTNPRLPEPVQKSKGSPLPVLSQKKKLDPSVRKSVQQTKAVNNPVRVPKPPATNSAGTATNKALTKSGNRNGTTVAPGNKTSRSMSNVASRNGGVSNNSASNRGKIQISAESKPQDPRHRKSGIAAGPPGRLNEGTRQKRPVNHLGLGI